MAGEAILEGKLLDERQTRAAARCHGRAPACLGLAVWPRLGVGVHGSFPLHAWISLVYLCPSCLISVVPVALTSNSSSLNMHTYAARN
jgi:hypothetical protein